MNAERIDQLKSALWLASEECVDDGVGIPIDKYELADLLALLDSAAKPEPPYIYEITEAGTVVAIGPHPPKEENNGQL